MTLIFNIVTTKHEAIYMQSVSVTTESRSGGVYSIQHYVIKFVSDLWQVGGFLRHRQNLAHNVISPWAGFEYNIILLFLQYVSALP
jgi:hypothetical protein